MGANFGVVLPTPGCSVHKYVDGTGQHVVSTPAYRIRLQLRSYKTFRIIASQKFCSNSMHSDRIQLLSIKKN